MFFLEVPFLTFLALHKENKVWPDGTHPMLFAKSSCVCIPSFRPEVNFFPGKSTIFDFFFFKYRKGCGYIDMLIMFYQ